MRSRNRTMVALIAVATLGLTGCGAPWGEAEVEAELESELDAGYAELAPHEVDCPGDLDAEAGEQMTCEFTDATSSGSVVVEILDVDGNDSEYEAQVTDYAEEPAGSD